MVQHGMIHARRDALLDFASFMIWIGDCKTNFEGSYGPVCKIHARRDAMSAFSWSLLGLAIARQTLRPLAPQSSCL